MSTQSLRDGFLQDGVFEPSYELVDYALKNLGPASKEQFINDMLNGELVRGSFNAAKDLGIISQDFLFRPAVLHENWTTYDIIDASDDNKITHELASRILMFMLNEHDAHEGINSDTIEFSIRQIKSTSLDVNDVLFNPDAQFVQKLLSEADGDIKAKLIDSITKGEVIPGLFKAAKAVSMIPDNQFFLPSSMDMAWTTYDVRCYEPDLSEMEASRALLLMFRNSDFENGINIDSINSARKELFPELDFRIPATVSWTDKDDIIHGESVVFNLNNGDIENFDHENDKDVQDLKITFPGCEKVYECAATNNIVFSGNEELIGIRDEIVDAIGEEGLQNLRIHSQDLEMGSC